MALDHVRDYFGSLAVNPTDLGTTTVPLFFTRWITHICAPVFFLLTGTGAYLALRRRSRSRALALSADARHLADRPRARRRSIRVAVQRGLPADDAHGPVGVRLGDGLSLDARVPPSARRGRHRCVDDRGAQSLRSHPAELARSPRAAVVRAPRARTDRVHFGSRGVRRVSADSLDRRRRGGIRAGHDLRLGRESADPIPAARRARARRSVRPPARGERVRRSGPVGVAAISRCSRFSRS